MCRLSLKPPSVISETGVLPLVRASAADSLLTAQETGRFFRFISFRTIWITNWGYNWDNHDLVKDFKMGVLFSPSASRYNETSILFWWENIWWLWKKSNEKMYQRLFVLREASCFNTWISISSCGSESAYRDELQHLTTWGLENWISTRSSVLTSSSKWWSSCSSLHSWRHQFQLPHCPRVIDRHHHSADEVSWWGSCTFQGLCKPAVATGAMPYNEWLTAFWKSSWLRFWLLNKSTEQRPFPETWRGPATTYIYLNNYGVWQMFLSRATYLSLLEPAVCLKTVGSYFKYRNEYQVG